MKKYIVKTSLGLLLFTTLFVACTDSFVDREPVYSIDSENYFNEAENRYLINKVDDLWHAKDYPNLVKVIEDYKGEIPELIRKKYLYSLKMIKK